MGKILRMESIEDYNAFIGQKGRHPLVEVVDFSQVKPLKHARKNYGFYAVVLKDVRCGDLRYGKKRYDYQDGTLVFVAPGQVVGNDDDGTLFQMKGWALLFHPDLFRGTPLGKRMKAYSYFSYEINEALHISTQERTVVLNCLHKINAELESPADKHTNAIIAANVEVLLDYCVRFYDRQFVTRRNEEVDVLSRFEAFMDGYFDSKAPLSDGLPTVKTCADRLSLSPNYFGDFIKKETGKSAQEYIQSKVVDRAKELIAASDRTISEIAYGLGFRYPNHLSRLFKNVVGVSPNAYRQSNRPL